MCTFKRQLLRISKSIQKAYSKASIITYL